MTTLDEAALQVALCEALRPYPEARVALAAKLLELAEQNTADCRTP